MKPPLEAACRRVAIALPSDPEVKAAWRTIYRAIRRGDRITSKTLPRIASLAQHAVAAREELDALIREVPPENYERAADARTQIVAIIAALEVEAAGRKDTP